MTRKRPRPPAEGRTTSGWRLWLLHTTPWTSDHVELWSTVGLCAPTAEPDQTPNHSRASSS